MARDRFIPKREVLPDIKYNDVLVSKFINVMMLKGKRSVSQHIMYVALDKLEEKTETSALKASLMSRAICEQSASFSSFAKSSVRPP